MNFFVHGFVMKNIHTQKAPAAPMKKADSISVFFAYTPLVLRARRLSAPYIKNVIKFQPISKIIKIFSQVHYSTNLNICNTFVRFALILV